MAHGHAIDAGAVGTAQIAQQHAITMHFHAGVSFGEGRIVNSDVSVAAAANQAGPRQGEAAAVVQTANSAQQPLLLVAAFLVLRRRRLQQALDFTLQDHLHAVHIHRIARTQQRHAPHRSTVHMNAADPVADLQPQAAIIRAELRQQQGTMAGIAEPHTAVGLAHDALHPGRSGWSGCCCWLK